MKYCVSARQPKDVLKKADEIKFDYKDRKGLYNFIEDEDLKNKKYIMIIPKEDEGIDWKELEMFAAKVDLTLALANLRMAKACHTHKLKFYWAYPITSFYELRGCVYLGVCELLLGAPLYFDLAEVKKQGLPIRLVANLCFDGYIPRPNGVCGTYVRPEDVPAYEKYVETLEFETNDIKKEAVLIKVYQEDKKWPGNLNLILTNFGENVDNRAIPEQFGEARTQCRQNCQRGGSCKLCFNAIQLSQALDRAKAEWVPGLGFKKA